MTTTELYECVKAATEDLVDNFLYYDRREDEELGVEEIRRALIDGPVMVDDVVQWFRAKLIASLEPPSPSGS